jgi:hypothetical protein
MKQHTKDSIKLIIADLSVIIAIVAIGATAFYQLGRIIESRQTEKIEAELDQAISDLTEMRVMREWELQQQN